MEQQYRHSLVVDFHSNRHVRTEYTYPRASIALPTYDGKPWCTENLSLRVSIKAVINSIKA